MGEYTCQQCGATYEAKREKPNRLCYKCGYEKVQEVILQIQDKRGLYYEKWKAGIRRAKDARKTGKRSLRPEG